MWSRSFSLDSVGKGMLQGSECLTRLQSAARINFADLLSPNFADLTRTEFANLILTPLTKLTQTI